MIVLIWRSGNNNTFHVFQRNGPSDTFVVLEYIEFTALQSIAKRCPTLFTLMEQEN